MNDHTDTLEFEIPANALLAVDNHHGIYCPQIFVDLYQDQLTDIGREYIQDVLSGPDSEYYLESWDHLTNNAKVVLSTGPYYIYQDMDIWLIPCEDKQ